MCIRDRTYSRTTDYSKLTITLDDSDLFSDITVVAAARTAGPVGQLWAPDGPIVVSASTTRTIVAPLRQPLAGVNGTLSYTVVTHGGRRVSSGVTVTPSWYAQRCVITVANANAYAVVLNKRVSPGRNWQAAISTKRQPRAIHLSGIAAAAECAGLPATRMYKLLRRHRHWQR